MVLEFGYIQRYDSNGFGFVSKELSSRHQREIYFHIKTIKRKYTELGQNIDNGSWHGVSFYYVTEHNYKGDAVSEIWLTTTELPQDLKSQLLALVESYWNSSASKLPVWLEKVTVDLIGEVKFAEWKDTRNGRILEQKQAEEKKLEEEKKKAEEARRARLELERILEEESKKRDAERLVRFRSEQDLVSARENAERLVNRQKIKAFCNKRGITTVIHFTRVENLANILAYGLLSRSELDSRDIEYVFNDWQRIDRYPNAISTSISFPNYKMFYRYRVDGSYN